MSIEKYDVIIAGLGPAGAVALYHLALEGFNVLGVEQRSFNNLWGKPCGDAIGAHHFENSKIPLPSSAVKNNVRGVDIYSPMEKVRYRIRGEGYIVDRKKLGQELVKSSQDKGAEVLFGASVVAPIIENGLVKGVVVKRGERKIEYRSNTVIEATGFSRVVKSRLPREWLIAEPIDPLDTNIAYRRIIAYEDYEIEEYDVIRIYLDQEIAPGGYWWYFPESRSVVNVGLGVQGGRGYPNPAILYERRLSRHKLLAPVHRIINAAGAPVPTRRPANTLVGPGIMVVGDAGYTVNPVHGGGMGYAFFSAYLAAKAFQEAYDKGHFGEDALWSLNLRYMSSVGAKQAALDIFRRFLQRLSNEELVFGMEKRLVPEVDVYEVSSSGELRVGVIEKAMVVLKGLRRPSILRKLKLVADYMNKLRKLYLSYPENPADLPKWISLVNTAINEFEQKLSS